MSKADKYHPIDVRYRGPSTAYRGSAHRQKNAAKSPASPGAKATTAPPAPAAAGPWGQKAKAAATSWGTRNPNAPRPHAPPSAQGPRRTLGLTRLQWFLLALAIYVILSSVPMLTLGLFDLSSTQMQSR